MTGTEKTLRVLFVIATIAFAFSVLSGLLPAILCWLLVSTHIFYYCNYNTSTCFIYNICKFKSKIKIICNYTYYNNIRSNTINICNA